MAKQREEVLAPTTLVSESMQTGDVTPTSQSLDTNGTQVTVHTAVEKDLTLSQQHCEQDTTEKPNLRWEVESP